MRSLKKAVLHVLPDGGVRAEILPDAPAGCDNKSGCAGCSGCGAAGAGTGLTVPLPGVTGRSEGELVEVWLDAPGQALLSITLLGLPLGAALGGGLLGNALLGERWLAIFGAAGLALGFAAVYGLSKSVLRVRAELA